MKKTLVALLLVLGMPTLAMADAIVSGTATRVGERLLSPSNPEGEGRSQIKVCGLISEPIADLRTCTFQLNDPSFSVTFNPAIYDLLSPNRGGKVWEVTFQSNQRTRPTLKAQFKAKGAQVDFCINIDRAEVHPEPAGIDIEP